MVQIADNDQTTPKSGFDSLSSSVEDLELKAGPKMQAAPEKKQIPENDEIKGNITGYLIFCLTLAVIGAAVQVGWTIGLYNTPIGAIRRFFAVTYFERYGVLMTDGKFDLFWSITNGLMPLGAMFGGLSSGITADFFGRKYGLLFTNLFVIAAGCLNIVSKFIESYETLMVARFLSGIFSGLFTGILPLYLNELSPQNYRGLIGTLNQFGIVFGILITNIVGMPTVLGSDKLWPILVSLTLVPVIAHIFLLLGVESPKYLFIARGRRDEAALVLLKLRGPQERELVNRELAMLENEKLNMQKVEEVSWWKLFSQPSLRHPLLIAMGVMVAQQFSGINAVIFYSTTIFFDIGLEGSWPVIGTILLGVVQLVMTLVCLVLIERAGRKVLLLIGMIGMALSSFALALFRIYGNADRPALNYLTVVAAVLYIIFFSIGPGAIPWLLTSELFDSEARAKANSVSTFVNWGSAFIVTVSFPFLERAITDYSFILFGGLLVIFSFFILFFVPETKNKSIDQVKLMLASQTVFLFEGSKKGETFNF